MYINCEGAASLLKPNLPTQNMASSSPMIPALHAPLPSLERLPLLASVKLGAIA
jgi:hypothetical protein